MKINFYQPIGPINKNIKNIIENYPITNTDILINNQDVIMNFNDYLSGTIKIERKNMEIKKIDNYDRFWKYIPMKGKDLSIIRIPVKYSNINKRIKNASNRLDINFHELWKFFSD